MHKTITLLVCLTSILTGCGFINFSGDKNQQNDNLNIDSVDLYVSRASLTRTEFEQYKITKQKFYYECGKINGSMPKPEVQNVKNLSLNDYSQISKLASDIVNFQNRHELNLDKEGKSTSMFDAGQFILTISAGAKPVEIKTSLDSITSATKTSENYLKLIAKKIREIALINSGSSLCGNRKFYEL